MWCKSTFISPNILVRTYDIYPSFNTEFATSKSHVSPKLLYVYVIDIRQTCYEYFYNVYAWFTLFLEERVEIQNVSCVAKIIDLTETNSYPCYKQFFNNNKIFRNIAIREPFIYCTFKQKTIYMMVSTFEHPSYKQVIATNMRNGNAREKLWESLQVILLTFFFVSVLFCSERNDFF